MAIWPLAVLLMSVSCILPPELEVGDFDAGKSSPPVVLSASPPELAFPGPISLDRQDPRTLSLRVSDNDISDIIYVQLYVDYTQDQPQPAFESCQAAPSGEVVRTVNCEVRNLCNSIDPADDSNHVLEAMVVDREFIPDSNPVAEGQPPFRAVKSPGEAAHSFRTWILTCRVEPS